LLFENFTVTQLVKFIASFP